MFFIEGLKDGSWITMEPANIHLKLQEVTISITFENVKVTYRIPPDEEGVPLRKIYETLSGIRERHNIERFSYFYSYSHIYLPCLIIEDKRIVTKRDPLSI